MHLSLYLHVPGYVCCSESVFLVQAGDMYVYCGLQAVSLGCVMMYSCACSPLAMFI